MNDDKLTPMERYLRQEVLKVQLKHLQEYRAGRFHDPVNDPKEMQEAREKAIEQWNSLHVE